MRNKLESWRETKVLGRIWECDDECDCRQAVIERITPNLQAGFPWIQRERLWEGKFYTDSSFSPWLEDKEPDPRNDLRAHLEEYGAIMQEEYYAQVSDC